MYSARRTVLFLTSLVYFATPQDSHSFDNSPSLLYCMSSLSTITIGLGDLYKTYGLNETEHTIFEAGRNLFIFPSLANIFLSIALAATNHTLLPKINYALVPVDAIMMLYHLKESEQKGFLDKPSIPHFLTGSIFAIPSFIASWSIPRSMYYIARYSHA